MVECWCCPSIGEIEHLIYRHGAERKVKLGLWRLPADAWPTLEAALRAMGTRLEAAS